MIIQPLENELVTVEIIHFVIVCITGFTKETKETLVKSHIIVKDLLYIKF